MPIYRKKPIELEAHQLSDRNIIQLAAWCEGRVEAVEDPMYLEVHTLEGIMKAKLGDYIIKGIAGEFYPCEEKIFENLYDLVKDYGVDGDPYEGRGRPYRGDNS